MGLLIRSEGLENIEKLRSGAIHLALESIFEQ